MFKGDLYKVGDKYTVERGIVTDWEGWDSLMRCAYKELGIFPAGTSLVTSEVSLNPKANREKVTNRVFRELSVHRFYIANSVALVLDASGRTTSFVLESTAA